MRIVLVLLLFLLCCKERIPEKTSKTNDVKKEKFVFFNDALRQKVVKVLDKKEFTKKSKTAPGIYDQSTFTHYGLIKITNPFEYEIGLPHSDSLLIGSVLHFIADTSHVELTGGIYDFWSSFDLIKIQPNSSVYLYTPLSKNAQISYLIFDHYKDSIGSGGSISIKFTQDTFYAEIGFRAHGDTTPKMK